MKKLLSFAVLSAFVLFFSSCNKNMGALDESYFKANPSPLEVKNGKVTAVITGQIPAKYFNKNAVVTVTPVMKFGGDITTTKKAFEGKGTPIMLQGEKIVGNNKTIAYKEGGTFTMDYECIYVPEMAISELYLEFDVVQKDKTYQIPTIKIADGVIATPTLLSSKEVEPVLLNDKFQRIIEEKEGADILFLIQQAQLRSSETKSATVTDLLKRVKEVQDTENLELTSFEISGYASPDGAFNLNKGLSEQRQKVTAAHVNRELRALKTSVAIDSKVTAEDWDGFQALVQASTLQDKNTILRVLSSYSDPEQREREIKNLSAAYTQLADEILPQLRRSRLTLTYNVVGKSDAEIAQLAKNNASSLNVEELLYAATLTNNLNEKASIYQTVINQYASDIRGYNNLGAVKYTQGKYDEAAALFAKAAQIDSKLADVNYNLGVVSLATGEWEKSKEYLANAGGTNANLSTAIGSLAVAQGDYAKAKSTFASEASNNAALTQILLSDYNGAIKTLNAISNPDATTAYLAAVVGARTNNKNLVYDNLKTAVQLDKTYAEKALTDIEFAKYAVDATFLSIVK